MPSRKEPMEASVLQARGKHVNKCVLKQCNARKTTRNIQIGDEMSAGTRAAKNPNWTRVTTVVTPVGDSTSDMKYYSSAKIHVNGIKCDHIRYLDSLGLVKKAMPNNGGSSIYRAVCESLSMDQNEHTSLQEFIESELLFQYRLQRIRTGLPTVNKIEDTLRTIARLLRIELHVYRTIGKQPFVYGGNPDAGESVEKVMVCESHCGHYDLVLTRKDHACLGYAQTFVYDLLYFNVFGFSRDVIKSCIKRVRDDMSKVNHPVDEVSVNVQPTTFAQEATCGERALSLSTDGLEMRFGWRPPMPYCAVKSLDPSVYRNVSYDIFLKERKRIADTVRAIQNHELEEKSEEARL
uniref:OTU domain-containing protein n=1 Tax=Angiostrongylus cantonensis TaxID=6313 RepID=A0A0K0DBF5_ANGCA